MLLSRGEWSTVHPQHTHFSRQLPSRPPVRQSSAITDAFSKQRIMHSSRICLWLPPPASEFHLMGTTWDGNRANGGSAQNGNDPTYALIAIRSSDSVISQAQIENGNAMGVLVDGDSQDPHNTRFLANYIHDNGGVVDAAGIGVGVRLGRTRCPDQTLFDGNHFERNYNTVGSIHFSNAINSACGINTLVTGNTFKDNLNTLGGGQLYLSDYNNTCTAEVSATITGNEFSDVIWSSGRPILGN